MRIRVLSDLHLEYFDWEPPPVDADVVVLAGDIHVGDRGLRWAREQFPRTPVIYLAGNHEFYGARLQELSATLRETGNQLGISVLDGDEVVIGNTRFLGATLWTDFALYGSQPRQIARAMAEAKRVMSDFHIVRYGNAGLFRPEHSRELHLAQVRWLERKLAEPFAGATVVATHHLPHRLSIHRKYEGDALNPAFTSDLDRLVRAPVALWIHGHTHESFDYRVNGTRVVCNPRGYVPIEPNAAFDPRLVVEVDAVSEPEPLEARAPVKLTAIRASGTTRQ
jgi:predicted phosphodiesterase